MIVKELRIVQPCTVAELERGQQYAGSVIAEQLTEPGKGGVLLSEVPYYHEIFGEGLFKRTIHHIGAGRVPAWVLKIVPASALILEEKTWLAFPYCRTVVTIPFLQKLRMEITSMHIDQKPTEGVALSLATSTSGDVDGLNASNACSLGPEDLKARVIEKIDIGSETVPENDYRADRDPSLVESTVTGRGPLTDGWQSRHQPLMCAYKVIKAEFNYWGIQDRVENLLVASMRQVAVMVHKTTFCLTDTWFHLDLEQVLDMEVATRERLCSTLALPEGFTAEPSQVQQRRKERAVALHEGERAGEGEGQAAADGAPLPSEEELEDFFDAEELEPWDIEALLAADGAGASAAELCPACPALAPDAPPCRTAITCTTCGEDFCAACFEKVHVTARLQQHVTRPVSLARAPSQVLRSGTLLLRSSTTLARARSTAARTEAGTREEQAPEEGEGEGEGEGKGEGEVLEEEEDAGSVRLEWEAVKDPPLNLRVTRAVQKTYLASTFAGLEDSPQKQQLLQAARLLRGEGEDAVAGQAVAPLSSSAVGLSEALASVGSALLRLLSSPSAPSGIRNSSLLDAFKQLRASPDLSFVPSAPQAPVPHPARAVLPLSTARQVGAAVGATLAAGLRMASQPLAVKGAPAGSTPSSSARSTQAEDLLRDPYWGGGGEDRVGSVGAAYEAAFQVTSIELPAISEERSAELVALLRLFRALTEELLDVSPGDVPERQRLVVWPNVFNALVLHGLLVYGPPSSAAKQHVLLKKTAYIMSDQLVSAHAIEKHILKCVPQARIVPMDFAASLFESPLEGAALAMADPRVLCALTKGTLSCAMWRPLSADGPPLASQLEQAAAGFLQAAVLVTADGRVVLPHALRAASRLLPDAGLAALLQWVAERVPSPQKEAIAAVASSISATRGSRRASTVTFAPQDLQFRYLLPSLPDA